MIDGIHEKNPYPDHITDTTTKRSSLNNLFIQ